MRPPRTLAAALLAATGCAPVLSGLQPASVVPYQKVHVSGGGDLGVSTGEVFNSVQTGIDLGKKVKDGGTLSETERDQVLDAALALALNFPVSLGWQLQGAYGFAPDFEVALRWAGSAWRLSGRWQFLHAGTAGIDASTGLGLGLYAVGLPVNDLLGIAQIHDFKRLEVDVPVLFGWSGEFGHFWFGPRLMLARYGSEITVTVAANEAQVAKLDGTGLYTGAQIGGALGWKYVWLAGELTVTWLSGGATLDVVGNVRNVPTRGLVVSPSFALIARFP